MELNKTSLPARDLRVGQTIVTPTPQPVTISFDILRSLTIKSDWRNWSPIYLGHSASVASDNGWALFPCEEMAWPIDDGSKLWAVSDRECTLYWRTL